MQTLLIQKLLNPLCNIMGRFSEKSKDRLFLLAGTAILLQMFLRLTGAVEYRYAIHFVSCCLLLGLMILASLGKEVRPVKFHRLLSLLWFSAGILRAISGFRNNIDHLPEAAMLLVAYPIIYICWSNAQKERIFRLLGNLCRIAIVIYALLSWLLSPIGWNKYAGILDNPNAAGSITSVATVGILLDILYAKKWSQQFIGDLLLLGLAYSLTFYTNSRSSMWGLYFALILGLVLYLLTHSWQENIHCLMRCTAGFFVCLVMTYTLVYPYQLRQWLPLPYLDADVPGFYTASREESLEDISPNWEELLQGKLFYDISGFLHISDIKNDMEDKDLNTFSTGRFDIWSSYAKDLNWSGHKKVPPIYIGKNQKEIKTTHMTSLQFAYESGIPMGAVYLIMNIATGILGILYACRHRKDIYSAGSVMYTAVFGVISMLESCGGSFGFPVTLFYYLTLFPIITRAPEELP